MVRLSVFPFFMGLLVSACVSFLWTWSDAVGIRWRYFLERLGVDEAVGVVEHWYVTSVSFVIIFLWVVILECYFIFLIVYWAYQIVVLPIRILRKLSV